MPMKGLTASLEDYLEAIWILGQKKRVVRVKDIAELLDVRAASVIGALKSLAQRGLVLHERYGHVELTSRGRARAREIYARHQTLTKFFHEVLGVDRDIAAQDACGIEHSIHTETVDRLVEFMEFMETCPLKEKMGLSEFRDYVESGRRPKGRRGGTQR